MPNPPSQGREPAAFPVVRFRPQRLSAVALLFPALARDLSEDVRVGIVVDVLRSVQPQAVQMKLIHPVARLR